MSVLLTGAGLTLAQAVKPTLRAGEADVRGQTVAARGDAEQIAAVFRIVVLAVSVAAVTGAVLAFTLVHCGLTSPLRASLFVAYIACCAAGHSTLQILFRRRHGAARLWAWGAAFTAVCFCEGAGWGWAPLGLVSGQDFGAQLVCLLVTLGMAAGSIPAFSPYLPAFLALFLPATVPFAVYIAGSSEPLRQGAAVLMILYLVGLGGLGLLMNRSYRDLVRLRLQAEGLAEDLAHQVEIAETANRAKSSFLAAASHDLRQPVHALGLFVGALRGMPMAPDAMRILEQIEASSQAMDALFAALLDISRLDAGIVDVSKTAFPIEPVLRRIGRDHVNEAIGKDITFTRHSCSAIVYSDPILVERIVRNLVSNAVRYTTTGRVVIGCRRRNGYLRIEVWDTGLGIPDDQRERIFQEYYQIGNRERDRAKGLGLGLAIVARLTKLIGCELKLCSRVGRGSCFAIILPLSRQLPQREQDKARFEQPMLLKGALIVVIDDEASIRAAMTDVLVRWGHTVIAAESGHEAIEKLADSPRLPDLIISDFRLRDDETGLDVIEALRVEFNEKIPAIIITGDTATERLAEAHATGLLLMHKPVSNGRLRAAIANTLAEQVDA